MANITIIEPHALLRLGLLQLISDLGTDIYLHSRGYPMKTVGRCLNISVATAKAHTETLYQRLDVHNRNAAVYAAVSRGAKLGWECMGAQEDTVVKHHLR